MNTETELAWAAGFFDGEGTSTSCRNKNQAAYPRLHVHQKDRRTLDRFHAAIGFRGSVGHRRSDGCYAWQASCNLGRSVMMLLWPYLSEAKKEQWFRVLDRMDEFNVQWYAQPYRSRRFGTYKARVYEPASAHAAETPVEQEDP